MDNREMLELAARAADINLAEWKWYDHPKPGGLVWLYKNIPTMNKWNPLADDGDALRLAVKLNLDIRYESDDAGVAVIVGGTWDGVPEGVHEIFERDGPRATRRAIVRVAAEIGRQIIEENKP